MSLIIPLLHRFLVALRSSAFITQFSISCTLSKMEIFEKSQFYGNNSFQLLSILLVINNNSNYV